MERTVVSLQNSKEAQLEFSFTDCGIIALFSLRSTGVLQAHPQGFVHNTHIYVQELYKGLQWDISIPSVVYGPRKALVRTKFVHMGIRMNPWVWSNVIITNIVRLSG